MRAPDQTGFLPPVYIPGVKYQEREQALPAYPMYAISIASLFTKAMKRVGGSQDIRSRLGLADDSRLVWAPFETDDWLESFWTRCADGQLLKYVAQSGVDYAVSPNFSLYGDQPRMCHLLNMKRSLIICSNLADVGIPAIPHVYWWTHGDLERWAKWVNGNVKCKWISVNFQTSSQGAHHDRMIRDLAAFYKLLQRPPRLLVVGITKASRLGRIAEIGFQISVIHYRAHILAAAYRIIDECGREHKVSNMSYADRLKHNTQAYQQIIKAVVS